MHKCKYYPEWDTSQLQGILHGILSGYLHRSLLSSYYTWVETGAVREECLTQQWEQAKLYPRPLDPGFSAVALMSQPLPHYPL